MAHFSLESLTFSYPDCETPSLKDVSLDVQRGHYVVLCGKSGCGKTTLLRHLKSVLAPYGTISGKILFDGVPLEEVDQRTQSEKIGFVMQNPDAQVVTDKVWHELAFGLESLGVDQRTMRLRVAEMASYFGIQHWFDKDVRDLSGGQKQLLSLASIMAMRPDVLILDEPTSQLDPIAASDFLNTVRKINIELGTTVIVTEHRLEDVFASVDRVVVLDKGEIIAQGTPREVGGQLYAQQHDMTFALPAPLRIFYGVNDASDVVAADAPLTVREGRRWLSGLFAEEAPTVRAIDDGSLSPGSPAAEGGIRPSDSPHPDATPSDAIAQEPRAISKRAGKRARGQGADSPLAIRVSDVWLRYERDLPDVLKDTSLSVDQGTTFAIVGGNGTGKSTLLKVLCASIKPYRGTVEVLGRNLKDWKESELFSGAVAMLPQDPANLFAKPSVREDLEEMLPADVPADEGQARIVDVAETCDIAHLMDSHPLDLSGGEQQRAALAKVLMCEPRILLLDEPTKGIDNFFKRKLAGVFEALKAEGRTIVLVSHDVEFCAHYADSVAMFFDGSVAATDTPQGFFSQASFYTTAANRMSRHVFDNAVTEEDVVELCLRNK